MPEGEQKVKYPNQNRRGIILTDRYRDATLAFSGLPSTEEQKNKGVENRLKEIQSFFPPEERKEINSWKETQ